MFHRDVQFAKALCDLRVSNNLMSFVVFHNLGLGTPKTTTMRILMADCLIKKSIGVIYDVSINVNLFIIPANFVVLDCAIDREVLIILGRLFPTTKKVLIDMECGEMKF